MPGRRMLAGGTTFRIAQSSGITLNQHSSQEIYGGRRPRVSVDAVVMGGTRGIGRAIAGALESSGHAVRTAGRGDVDTSDPGSVARFVRRQPHHGHTGAEHGRPAPQDVCRGDRRGVVQVPQPAVSGHGHAPARHYGEGRRLHISNQLCSGEGTQPPASHIQRVPGGIHGGVQVGEPGAGRPKRELRQHSPRHDSH